MFIDEIKIYARAGHGGKGCVAFQREKYRPKGGPSGGNGGRGGEVILEADHDLNNLIAQYYQPRLLAQDGVMGLGKGMDGHAGKDLVVIQNNTGASLAINSVIADNGSATATLLQAAPIFLKLAREGKLERDVWLLHLTGEEFPSDCMGARVF